MSYVYYKDRDSKCINGDHNFSTVYLEVCLVVEDEWVGQAQCLLWVRRWLGRGHVVVDVTGA